MAHKFPVLNLCLSLCLSTKSSSFPAAPSKRRVPHGYKNSCNSKNLKIAIAPTSFAACSVVPTSVQTSMNNKYIAVVLLAQKKLRVFHLFCSLCKTCSDPRDAVQSTCCRTHGKRIYFDILSISHRP